MAPSNSAAWLSAKRETPLKVGPAPYPTVGENQILIRNHAIAINPVDWFKQRIGNLLLDYLKYPCILGNDVAGEVVEVGPGVTRFKIGDRVLGESFGTSPFGKQPDEGAFQEYMILRDHGAAIIPDPISYEQACAVPLGFSVAAYGLFHEKYLALDVPTVPFTPQKEDAKVVIITSGSSSVGSNAIQLAVAAGYQVYTTASPKNFAFVEKLGASKVFDYHSKTLVDDMLAELKGKTLAGAYAISSKEAIEDCQTIVGRHKETTKRFVAASGAPIPNEQLNTSLGRVGGFFGMLWYFLGKAVWGNLTGIQVSWILAFDLGKPEKVVGRLYREFLSQALESGEFIPAPPPLVVGKGLHKIQEAMDVHMAGVSAQKVVVSL